MNARRALHFAVFLEDYTRSVYSSVHYLEPSGVIQEGVNTGAFSPFSSSFLPHRPPPVLAFIFYREKGSAVPIPRQH